MLIALNCFHLTATAASNMTLCYAMTAGPFMFQLRKIMKNLLFKNKIAKKCRKALQKLAKINYGDKRNGLYSFFLLTFETVG